MCSMRQPLLQLQGSRRLLEFCTSRSERLGLGAVQPSRQVTGSQVPGELRFSGMWKGAFKASKMAPTQPG